MKREIPLLITGMMGIFLIVQSFIPHPPINELDSLLNDFALIVFVFTMILGLLNLFYMNLQKVYKQRSGWGYSAVTVLAFSITMIFGFFNPGEQTALRTKTLDSNTTLIKTVGMQVASDVGSLDTEKAELVGTIIAKVQNPGMAIEKSFLEHYKLKEADVETLMRYGRIRTEPFDIIFSARNISREQFDALYDETLVRAGRLIDDATPIGAEIKRYAETMQEVLLDNDTFIEALLIAAKADEPAKADSLMVSAREATAPLLKASIQYNGKPIPVGTTGETILRHIVEQGLNNVNGMVGQLREEKENPTIERREVLNTFNAKSAINTLFYRAGETGVAASAESIALANVPKGKLNEETFKISVAALFGKGGDAKFDLPPLEKGSGFQWIFEYVYAPLASTMFALLAFFIASAAYRAFRIRSSEAALLLGAGFIVMLGQIPIGNYLTFWLPESLQMSNIADWIMMYPNMASQRAIMIGVALGVISTALKIILGLERGYLGGE